MLSFIGGMVVGAAGMLWLVEQAIKAELKKTQESTDNLRKMGEDIKFHFGTSSNAAKNN